jgi:hypothetical protein
VNTSKPGGSPAEVAVRVLAPTADPRIHLDTVARPSVPVVTERGSTVPPPDEVQS